MVFNSPYYLYEELASPKANDSWANGNCDSPLLGVNTHRSDDDRLKLIELMIFLLQEGVCDDIGFTAARLSSYCCHANIFTGLAQMGYEKPSTKLTSYKAFFSRQWKFLIHTILQSLSAKRTSWNKFSTAMASAVICLSKGAEQVQVDAAIVEDIAEDVAHVLDTCSDLLCRIEHFEHDNAAQRLEIIKLKAKVVAASTPIPAVKPKILKIAAAPAVSTRRRKGVVIRDPDEELPSDTSAENPKSRKEMEAEDQEIIKSINETPTQKATKRRKLSEEAQEAEHLRKRLEIVKDEGDDVFVEATPLAQKVPVVDYQIVVIDNKP
nr:hypothetical protein [Tanacetum cinerariifolium]